MSVEIHVERLVIEGFDGLDGRAVARALESELARRLSTGPLDPAHLARLGGSLEAEPIGLPHSMAGARLGRRAAEAVGGLLAVAAAPARAAAPAAPSADQPPLAEALGRIRW